MLLEVVEQSDSSSSSRIERARSQTQVDDQHREFVLLQQIQSGFAVVDNHGPHTPVDENIAKEVLKACIRLQNQHQTSFHSAFVHCTAV